MKMWTVWKISRFENVTSLTVWKLWKKQKMKSMKKQMWNLQKKTCKIWNKCKTNDKVGKIKNAEKVELKKC